MWAKIVTKWFQINCYHLINKKMWIWDEKGGTVSLLWHIFPCFICISSLPPPPTVPKLHIATIQGNDNPFPSPPLPLRLGNQWAASPGETGLPRHKSHTHTIFHPVSPSFILFSTLPLFPSHCLPLPPLLLFWLCFSIPVFIMLPQVPRYYSFYLSYLTFLYFSVSFSHFFPTIVSPPPPFVSLSLSRSLPPRPPNLHHTILCLKLGEDEWPPAAYSMGVKIILYIIIHC